MRDDDPSRAMYVTDYDHSGIIIFGWAHRRQPVQTTTQVLSTKQDLAYTSKTMVQPESQRIQHLWSITQSPITHFKKDDVPMLIARLVEPSPFYVLPDKDWAQVGDMKYNG